MSTSFVYHAMGLSGYEYVHQKFEGGRVTFRLRPKWQLLCCPVCKSKQVTRRGMSFRKLRSLPIGRKPICLLIEVPRVWCAVCGCIRRIRLGIAEPRRSYTRAFARHVLDLTKLMTLKDVALFLGVGWDCVKDILKRNLTRRFARPRLRSVRYLAIDEISVRKGHKYLTLVMDLESGAVLFVGDGKGAKSLEPFWVMFRRSRAKVQAVATDMSTAYIGAVLENLPGVPLVFDHFHVVKLMNEALTEIRRGLHRESDAMGKKVLKGSRWILLKNPENLSTERNEAAKLQEALKLNEPLATAYYMKEDLRQFWSQKSKDIAQSTIDDWIKRAQASGIGPLMRMATTLAGLKFGILNWYEHPISSGRMEGTNNKIKVLKRMAYGYRDMEFFKLRILAIHEAKYALTDGMASPGKIGHAKVNRNTLQGGHPMNKTTLIGIDLAKNIFRINCLDGNGKRVMNKNLHRESVIPFFAPLPECTVAMEACASSHYWGRTIESMGHTVRLIHPRYVTPYRLGDKNDANDAAAICAAAQRPDMRFVRLRSQRQSDVQALHRVREGLVTEKTATVNRVRSLLAENGIAIKQGPANVFALLPAIVDDHENDLSGMMRQLLRAQYAHLCGIRDQLAELETMLKSIVAEDDACKRLMQIPGLGLITATLLSSELGNGSAFRNGRSFAAYLGLTPRQHSSGGKNVLLGISKRGNRYLRTLLIHCARSILRSLALGKTPFGEGALDQWVRNLLERRGKNKTAVAIAAKLARVAWAMLAKGSSFEKAFAA